MTLLQRARGAFCLSNHIHSLCPDGVYLPAGWRPFMDNIAGLMPVRVSRPERQS